MGRVPWIGLDFLLTFLLNSVNKKDVKGNCSNFKGIRFTHSDNLFLGFTYSKTTSKLIFLIVSKDSPFSSNVWMSAKK